MTIKIRNMCVLNYHTRRRHDIHSGGGSRTKDRLAVMPATMMPVMIGRCGELGVLRVREHPLNVEVHPLSHYQKHPLKMKENL